MSSQGDSQPSQGSVMTIMQENREEILYFAYGSNLSTEQMRQRCPYSTPIGLGHLAGWKWFINERGFANIAQLPANANDEVDEEQPGVYGLLYLLPPPDEERLDAFEGVPDAYQKFQTEVKWVRDAGGEEVGEVLRALIYVDGRRTAEDKPREEYVGRMERGIEDAVPTRVDLPRGPHLSSSRVSTPHTHPQLTSTNTMLSCSTWALRHPRSPLLAVSAFSALSYRGRALTPPAVRPAHLRSSAAPSFVACFSQRSFPAWFARGGTSNGLVIRRQDLPAEDQWHAVLPAAMGSPDSYGRQLDGMGSGISSTSKIVILGPPSRPDVHVDFTFIQVGIKDGVLDMAGNCGNMSALVGPVAFDRGMIPSPTVEQDEHGHQWGVVRFLNTNTSKVMVSRFKVSGSPLRYSTEGDYVMDGVPGSSSRITMSFMDPAGAKTGKALPTGSPVDTLQLPDGSAIQASLVDVGNPGVFISTESLGLSDQTILTPQTVEADPGLKERLAEIRRAGASMMGLDPQIESVPKIVLLFPSSGSSDIDIKCLALSMGQAHKAVPLTLALCLGAASQLPGTIASHLIGGKRKETVTIGHPSGKVDIGTVIRDGKIEQAAETGTEGLTAPRPIRLAINLSHGFMSKAQTADAQGTKSQAGRRAGWGGRPMLDRPSATQCPLLDFKVNAGNDEKATGYSNSLNLPQTVMGISNAIIDAARS
ncbi:hypothetical protein G7046_g4189 [Stylonectria norvegica]|nr:hypothetical protein G7046_g4189 [Stylonectria norvegica]